MAEYLVQDSSLEAIADAIRERTGSSAAIAFPDGFVGAIANMGGNGLSALVDETITVSSNITAETTIFTSERLAGLDWYIIYFYQTSENEFYRLREILVASDMTNGLYAHWTGSAVQYQQGNQKRAYIDDNGSVKVCPNYNTTYPIRTGEYHLIVFG